MQIANRRSSGVGLRRGRRSSKFRQMARSRPLESRSGDRSGSIGGLNMRRIYSGVLGIVAFLGSSCFAAAETPIERGQSLVTLGGCGDCHTPGTFLGHPDKERLLAGSEVGFAVRAWASSLAETSPPTRNPESANGRPRRSSLRSLQANDRTGAFSVRSCHGWRYRG
jgi:hypothetical protein